MVQPALDQEQDRQTESVPPPGPSAQLAWEPCKEGLQTRACTCSTGAQIGKPLAGVTSVRRGLQLRPRSVDIDHTISCDAEPSYHTSAACDAPPAQVSAQPALPALSLCPDISCYSSLLFSARSAKKWYIP